ncbi:ribonuclease H2 subunit B [Scaptodrosophila lebanonensis]|uniref:Ribonuclease H2 subunit B n=1 Tax=Drosophila lebanonensis TaxID=7225 RepID=A0A6J2UG63_DROLE|nr:ribonuclease H2 subunit B [Scaptodrosophila lebanonensis]
MSKKATRSTQPKPDPDAPEKHGSEVVAPKKVFYISENLINNVEGEEELLHLERFFHPGKGRDALFVTLEQEKGNHIMELVEYSEPRRSWLIDSEVCSNGRIYMTTPVDTTFLALHYLRKYCAQRAMSLDSIHDDQDASANRLLMKFVNADHLKCVADVKVSGNTKFYKYNAERTKAWLAVKTRKVVDALKENNVYCGTSAQSQNFVRSEKHSDENTVNETDYLRMACDYVGRYLDVELYDELVRYLKIPTEIQALAEDQAQKRKSEQAQTNNSKKIKLNSGQDASSGLLDSSIDDAKESITSPTIPTPLKERTLTAKEKALAKGAKGSMSISSFFKVK